MPRAIHHSLASAVQFAEKFVVAENRRRGGLSHGGEGCLDWGLDAGRARLKVDGGIEQATDTEVIRRVSWDDRSATVASASGTHGFDDVRAHSTGYYRNER